MGLHPVMPVQPCRQHQPVPLHAISAPADATRVGLAFHRVQLVPAFEADASGGAQEQTVGSSIGTGGELLAGIAVKVIAQPGLAELIGIRMHAILGAGKGRSSLGEQRAASGIVSLQGAGALEGFGLADQPHASFGFTQAGDADLAGRFQPGEHHPHLRGSDP